MKADIKIFSIGDCAATIGLGNCVDDELNQKILAMHAWLAQNPFTGLKDIIIAYCSLSVYYDAGKVKKQFPGFHTAFDLVKSKLEEAYAESSTEVLEEPEEIINIPVCYDDDFGYDLDYVSSKNKLTKDEIIALHHNNLYKVYMVGFLPGFAYMGKIDERLMVSRKLKPVPVTTGSVGITGSQTGIYPVNCPGGWQIIGRTPVKLFDADAEIPIKLTLGARVRFYPIMRVDFENMVNSEAF